MVLIKLEAHVEYDYDTDNRLGRLYGAGGRLCSTGLDIYVYTPINESHSHSLEVTHRNFVRVIFIDKKNKNLVCEVPGTPLKKYVSDWKREKVKVSCFNKYKLPARPQDKYLPATFQYYMYPAFRSLIRDLYVFVHDMHETGQCLTSLNLEHLFVSNGILKVIGVGFRPRSPENMGEDFNWVADDIENLFRGQEWTDIVLASLLEKTRQFSNWAMDDNYSKGVLLVEHLTIQHPRRVLNFIMTCGENIHKYKMLALSQSYENLLDGMISGEDWNAKFESDEYLTLIRHQIESYRGYRYTGYDDETRRKVKENLITCARNLLVHFKADKDLSDGSEAAFLRVESVLMFLFKDYFLSLQQSMENLGYLDFYLDNE